MSTSTHARSHKQAAIKSLKKNEQDLGICMIVSDSEIIEDNFESQVFFLTENILAECGTLKLVK